VLKLLEHKVDPLPPFIAKINVWSYTSTPQIHLHSMALNYARDVSSWCGG